MIVRIRYVQSQLELSSRKIGMSQTKLHYKRQEVLHVMRK
jgi:hypothetical protein